MFSIITPHKPGRQKLKRAVESILSQKLSDWELIIVCDGQIDCTSNDKRIKIYGTEPTGRYGHFQRTVGIKKAKYEYVLFLDDDDFLTENALTNIKVSLEKNNRPDILIAKTFGQYGHMPHEPFDRPKPGSIGTGNFVVKSWLAKKIQWPHSSLGTLMDNRYCDFKFINACWYETDKTFYDPDLIMIITPRFSFGA